MDVRPLAIADAYELTPVRHADDRGLFAEVFRADVMKDVLGYAPETVQVNLSVFAGAAIRRVHYAEIPPGQSKYVMVTAGRIIDFVIDLRVGSPTFGRSDSVILDAIDRRAVFVAEGLGHAFVSLADDTVVSYLVSDRYRPDREHGLNPLDAELGLVIPDDAGELLISQKDREAPGLSAALAAGRLPTWEQAQAGYAELRAAVMA